MEAGEPNCVGVDPVVWQAQMQARADRQKRGEGERAMTDAEMAAEFRRLRSVMAERDWAKESPFNIANTLMNHLGQSPLFGSNHPVVRQGLFRVREACARTSNAMDGVFL